MKECGLELLEQNRLESAEQNWLLEDESTSTRENALFTLRKLWSHPLCAGASPTPDPITIAIVTSPFHQRRSLLTFERAYRDLTAQTSEVRPSSCFPPSYRRTNLRTRPVVYRLCLRGSRYVR